MSSHERYSRQTRFAPIGEQGQEALRQKHALIVGAGALGCGNAELLVRAGVGRLTIIDRDYVDWSNLQRQQLYTEQDAERGLPKAVAAKQRLSQINSEVQIEAIVGELSAKEILAYCEQGIDVMIDATDNFETRLLLNDASQQYSIPWVFGSCTGSYGMSMAIIPGKTPCFRCLLPHLPAYSLTCDNVGVIGPAVAMTVSYQAAEALKLLTGREEAVRPSLAIFDVWANDHMFLRMGKKKQAACLSCGEARTYPALNEETGSKAAVLCGRDTVQLRLPYSLDFEQLAEHMKRTGQPLQRNPYLAMTELEGHRVVLFQDGRVLIHGTKDIQEARTLYQRYFG
ncbi:ThiF family adenylyltransferase [Ectobacillus ponti]|uniref:ThiF family adenylyltransferase n=1 Tax=Ectobacillus ponti TaxID=2961894 RepID=A0AA41X735_9BACI|nr:ThiF family adenylyltransferase [Ectobacillus ponti]MCP8967530.1 ThiF family adenylyltransferase [Ectobacillus ponti]